MVVIDNSDLPRAGLKPTSSTPQTKLSIKPAHSIDNLIAPWSRKLNGTVLPSKGINGIALSEFNVSALKYARLYCSQWISKEHINGIALKIPSSMVVHPNLEALSLRQLRPASDQAQFETCIKHTSNQHQTGSWILPSTWSALNGTVQRGSMAFLSTNSMLVPSMVLHGTALAWSFT